MNNSPLTIHSFLRAILHIDGDAFFAACEQARNPAWQGKPVITGKERGIASSMSYEAKAKGVERGMRFSEIKKICPEAVFLPSDYETYSLLSKRLYSIVRRYTPDVEEYSIDECFADITGLRRPLKMNYFKIAERIKHDLDSELGFTFSVGLAPNKVVAKLASKWKKPSGLTVIPGREIHTYIHNLPVEKVWGIGSQTTAFLQKQGVFTALQYAKKDEAWIKTKLTKPFYEIWQELNGKFVFALDTSEKESYASIQKMKTFTPASNNKEFVFAQLSKNIENACIKLRKYNLAATRTIVFLRTQDFRDIGVEIRFSRPTAFPNEILTAARPAFNRIFKPRNRYRSTGVTMFRLVESKISQMDLFGATATIEKMTKLYQAVDDVRSKHGKHTLFLGTSFAAHKFAQHLGDRGDTPKRKSDIFKGETKRKRLAIPMFIGKVQ